MKKGCFFLVFLFVLACAGGGYYYYKKTHQPPEYDEEEIDEGEIRQLVSATGSLAAYTTVDVGCQISGILASVSVDFNDMVKEGQLLAQIDPSTFEAQVQQATAQFENAQASEQNISAQIENLKASLITAHAEEKINEANLKKTEVQVGDAQRNLRRSTELFTRKLISASDLETAQSSHDAAKATRDGALAQIDASRAKQLSVKAQISAANAQLQGAKHQINSAQAQLNIARINLGRTSIKSPIDGIVISRKVDSGQTVAASLQAPSLFSIANDLKKMQINTAVDESDIGKVSIGQRVDFTVDAYRGQTFQGKVAQVRLSPTITQNVVNYSVMIDVENNDLALKPGMTANVEILTDKRDKVVRVPTRAIFFKPSPKSGGFREKEKTAEDDKEGEPDQGRRDELGTDSARVWVKISETQIKPVRIKIGLSNNESTEISEGKLKPGDLVVVAERKAGEKPNGSTRGASRGRRGGLARFR